MRQGVRAYNLTICYRKKHITIGVGGKRGAWVPGYWIVESAGSGGKRGVPVFSPI